MVVGKNDNGTIQIINPAESNVKKSVAPRNLKMLDSQAKDVSFKGSDYYVTLKGAIISKTTNNVMKWATGNPTREKILELAKKSK